MMPHRAAVGAAHLGSGPEALAEALSGPRLTVLCYHRIADPEPNAFAGFRPNISATPEAFERQIRFLTAHYNVVSQAQVLAWLDGDAPLPRRAALVTFDDGYRDNATVAWPILRRHGVRPVIFLATDYMDGGRSFLWDLAAYCLERTRLAAAELPLVGRRALDTLEARRRATSEWMAAVKRQPSDRREEELARLAAAADVGLPETALPLCMDWEEARRLAAEGVDFGGHTCSHPILSRSDDEDAEREIVDCRARLARELGSEPALFAYPNGGEGDFTPFHEEAVARAGFRLAFSLENKSWDLASVRERPMAVSRVYLGRKDVAWRFRLKLLGAGQWAARLRRGR